MKNLNNQDFFNKIISKIISDINIKQKIIATIPPTKKGLKTSKIKDQEKDGKTDKEKESTWAK